MYKQIKMNKMHKVKKHWVYMGTVSTAFLSLAIAGAYQTSSQKAHADTVNGNNNQTQEQNKSSNVSQNATNSVATSANDTNHNVLVNNTTTNQDAKSDHTSQGQNNAQQVQNSSSVGNKQTNHNDTENNNVNNSNANNAQNNTLHISSQALSNNLKQFKTQADVSNNAQPNLKDTKNQSNTQKAMVSFVDDSTNTKLSEKDLNGQANTTSNYRPDNDIKYYTDRGYSLINNNYPQNGVQFNNDGTDQSFALHFVHAKTSINANNTRTPGQAINPNDPNSVRWPDGTDSHGVQRVVNQNIKYQYENGKEAAPEQKESVTFNRTFKVDNVTGKIVDDDGWQAKDDKTSFDAKQSPQIAGYQASVQNVPAVTELNDNSADQNTTVVYHPNKETANVHFVDLTTNKELASKTLNGHFNVASDYKTDNDVQNYTNKGYVFIKSEYPSNGDVFTKDGQVQNFHVFLVHGTTVVNPAKAQKPGQAINPNDPNGVKWPNGTDQNSLQHTVTENIKYQHTDGSAAGYDANDSTTFNHEVVVDNVTGQITKDNGWTAVNGKTSFSSKTSPSVYGYTPTTYTTAQVSGLNQNSQNINDVVKYNPNNEYANVHYIDDTTNEKLDTKELTGKFNTVSNYRANGDTNYYLNRGYVFVDSDYPQDGVKYDVDGSTKEYNIHLKHANTTIDVNNTKTPGDSINPNDPNSVKWPNGTDQSGVASTVTQTIKYQYADGKKAANDVNDATSFQRSFVVDNVTGQIVKDNGWTPVNGKDSFTAKQSPSITGYTASQLSVPASNGLHHDSPNQNDVVVFNPNTEKAGVKFIDDNTNKQLSYKDVYGKYNTTSDYHANNDINQYINKGYALVSSDFPDQGIKYNLDGITKNYEIHLAHVNTTIDQNNTRVPGQPINPSDPNGAKWPANSNNVTKTIHQTIKYQCDDGKPAANDSTDTVTLNHSFVVDNVTGQIVKDNGWTAVNGKDSFTTKVSPTINGYTTNTKSIVGTRLNENSKDYNATVVYTPNDEQASVKVMDDTANVQLAYKDLYGKFNTKSSYNVNDDLNQYLDKGYQLVNSDYPQNGITFNRDGDKPVYTLHLTHKITNVNPSNPQVPGKNINSDDPNGVRWPNGTDKNNLEQVITRTIHYKDDKGNTVSPDVKETVVYQHSLAIDNVTGQIVKDNGWQALDNKESFDAMVSPVIKGYTANIKEVGSLGNINQYSSSIDQTVIYHQDDNNQSSTSTTNNANMDNQSANNSNNQTTNGNSDINSNTKNDNSTTNNQNVDHNESSKSSNTNSTNQDSADDNQKETNKATNKAEKTDAQATTNTDSQHHNRSRFVPNKNDDSSQATTDAQTDAPISDTTNGQLASNGHQNKQSDNSQTELPQTGDKTNDAKQTGILSLLVGSTLSLFGLKRKQKKH